MTQEARANDFANALCEKICAARSDAEVVALCQKYEAKVMRLKEVAPVRFLHVQNAALMMRRRFSYDP